MGRINYFVYRTIVFLLFMLCFSSGALAADKITINQSVVLSATELRVYPGQVGVLSPTVEAQVNYVASDHFNIYFSIDGVTGSEDPVAGTTTYTDPQTGSTVEKVTHTLRIGSKEGTFNVTVSAVPMKGYEDLYRTETTTFKVIVEKATPTVYLRPYTSIYAYINSDNKGVALPKINDVILIKDSDIPTASDTTDLGINNFTYRWNVLKGNVSIKNGLLYGTSNTIGDKAQIECTITPKSNVTNQYKVVTKTVDVELVANSGKKITYACYPHNGVQNVFAGHTTANDPSDFFLAYLPLVIDEDGIDVSGNFGCTTIDFNNCKYEYNEDKSGSRFGEIFHDQGWDRTNNVHSSIAWNRGGSSAGYLHADGSSCKDVFDVSFSPISNNNIYETAKGEYTVQNIPRIPTISFNPDPSTIDFRTGFLLTYLNRFKPSGTWTDPVRNKTYNLVYQGEPKGQNDYTFYYYFAIKCSDIDGNKIQYWASSDGSELKKQDVSRIKEIAHVVTINGEKYYEFNTTNGWGNDNTWNIYINEPTKFNIYYRFAMDWSPAWTFKSDYTSLTLDIKQLIKTKMTLEPSFTVAEPNEVVPAPAVSIVALDGDAYDHQVANPANLPIKDLFKLEYSILSDNTNGTTVNSTTGQVTVGTVKSGQQSGEIQVVVKAVPKKSVVDKKTREIALYNSANQLMGNPYDANQAVYTIMVDPNYSKYYEVINSQSAGRMDSVIGKLHFVQRDQNLAKTHNFFPGTSFKGIPGLNVTLGDAVYAKKGLLSGYYVFSNEKGKVEASDDDDLDKNKSYYVTVPDDRHTDTLITSRPTNAIVLKPYTNGFFTVDYYHNNGNNGNGNDRGVVNLVLATEDGSILKECSNKDNGYGGFTFKAALLAGKTYYLYNKATSYNSFMIHGMNYQPAFVKNEGDQEATKTASVFTNGFMGGIPTIINGETAYVSLESSNTSVATVAQDGTITPNISDGSTTITATVTSAVDFITKTPEFTLSLRTIPYYKVLSQDDENKVRKSASHTYGNTLVGDTVTTRNYATDITMTFGGVKSYTNPYTNQSANDSWATPAADDTKGLVTIDGFDLFTKGAKDVSDEKYKSYPLYSYKADNSGANNTFTLPVHGSFVKFEPRESGTLIVYLLQNGVCDYQKGGSNWVVNGSNLWQAKWRPLYIVDQTGKPVTMNNNFQDNGAMPFGAENSGSYTTGIVLSDCNDPAVTSYINGHSSAKQDAKLLPNSTYDWSKFISWYSEDSQDKVQAEENAENMANKIIDIWRNKSVGDAQDIIRLGNGSFLTLHKSFVRYSFDVEAGKSYYIFQYKSKIAPCGYAFLPDNWDPSVSMTARQNSVETRTLYDTAGKEYSNNKYSDSNVNVTLDGRTFTAGQWGSICLPFSVSQTEFYRVFGQNAMIITYDGLYTRANGNNVAKFTQHDYHMIEAGRPYLVKPTQNVSNVTFQHVTFDNPEPRYFYVTDGQDNWYYFKGTYDYTRMAPYSYATSSRGMLARYTAAGGAYIRGFRAYLDFQGTEADAKRAQLWFDDDETTVIPSMEIDGVEEEANLDNKIYNLQGIYLGKDASQLPAGVYVRNGRKIIKK